ncbi:cell wall hydrolase [Aurantiacibacter flavus]|uniref:Cell wall hydrolase n=1 Tax=Aurantiacibacter flavus TaxID=3145232 RepID=A0ABV0CYT9_9SPHN
MAALILVLGATALVLVGARGIDSLQAGGWASLDGESDGFDDVEAPPLEEIVRDAQDFSADKLLPIEAKTAKQINDSRPFSIHASAAARPFNSRLSDADRERAATCLAIAALYEAGGSADDQRPVMQVVLNRVRHPAWPNTVCGVVFQGAERATGCQFSFTCDGSMLRWRPSPPALTRARALAEKMLGKEVDERVGWATHYHTDWVVPYWSESLDKLTAVKTHLFFRWKGPWGTGPAFGASVSSTEPLVSQLAALDPAHAIIDVTPKGEGPIGGPAASGEFAVDGVSASKGAAASPTPAFARPIIQPMRDDGTPGRWALDAVAACEGKAECRVVGWAPGSAQPWQLDSDGLAAMPPDLIYVQTLRERTQQVYWNCTRWQRAGTARCIAGAEQAASLSLVEL